MEKQTQIAYCICQPKNGPKTMCYLPVLDGGISAVRSAESMLNNNLLWDIPDSICAVNGNALKENVDTISTIPHNKIRFETYYERLKEYEKVSVSDITDIIGQQKQKQMVQLYRLHITFKL